MSQHWSCGTWTLWWEEREMRMESGKGLVSPSLSRMNERGLMRLNTHNWGQNTGFITIFHSLKGPLLWFYFIFSFLYFKHWNANVTFKLLKGHWKWTAMSRVYLVWIGGVERRENVITSKGNLTEEEEEKKKKNRLSYSYKWENRMTIEGIEYESVPSSSYFKEITCWEGLRILS